MALDSGTKQARDDDLDFHIVSPSVPEIFDLAKPKMSK